MRAMERLNETAGRQRDGSCDPSRHEDTLSYAPPGAEGTGRKARPRVQRHRETARASLLNIIDVKLPRSMVSLDHGFEPFARGHRPANVPFKSF